MMGQAPQNDSTLFESAFAPNVIKEIEEQRLHELEVAATTLKNNLVR
jgi:hypothetical protein